MRNVLSLLQLGLIVLGLSACSSDSDRASRSYSYDFQAYNCRPQFQVKGSYISEAEMCQGLLSAANFNPCASDEINRYFETQNCHRNDVFLHQNPALYQQRLAQTRVYRDTNGRAIFRSENRGAILLDDMPKDFRYEDYSDEHEDYYSMPQTTRNERAYNEGKSIEQSDADYYYDAKRKKAIYPDGTEIDYDPEQLARDQELLSGKGSSTGKAQRPTVVKPHKQTPPAEEKVSGEEKKVTVVKPKPVITKKPEPSIKQETPATPKPAVVNKPEVKEKEEVVKTPVTPEKEVTETPTEEPKTEAVGFNLLSFKESSTEYTELPRDRVRIPILKIVATVDSKSPLFNKKYLGAATNLTTEILSPDAKGCEIQTQLVTLENNVVRFTLQMKNGSPDSQISICKDWFNQIKNSSFKIRTQKLTTDKGSVTGELEFVNRD